MECETLKTSSKKAALRPGYQFDGTFRRALVNEDRTSSGILLLKKSGVAINWPLRNGQVRKFQECSKETVLE